jgi:Na+-transporting NADH:ubiquinone oxidoreductase subunit C
MKRDSTAQTLLAAAMLCIVCSVIVASAAVGLRPLQDANKRLDKKKNVLIAAGIVAEGEAVSQKEIDDQYAVKVRPVLIDLKTGNPVDPKIVDPKTYDQRTAAADPSQSEPISRTADLAGIKRREKFAFVYEVVDESGKLEKLVLPINGKGLWSTLYGFLALADDGSTVRGITFYEHGETAGLGAEVDNPKWKAIWPGKQVFDETGKIRLEVIKGSVSPSSPNVQYEVDGISGATITSKGVSNLIHYWLGPEAFGPFLDHLRQPKGSSK